MPERPFTAAVTGMGALIGQGIARSLTQGGRARVIGIDRQDSPLGASLCDAYVVKPDCPEMDPAYLAFWTDLIGKHRIDLIMPGISVDMDFFDTHRQVFADLGVRVVLNTPELISVTRDKFDFMSAYAPVGLPMIPSARPDSWADAVELLGPPPLLLKPRRGEGSQGIGLLQDAADFDYWTRQPGENWLVQRRVGTDDQEYTLGTFGFGDGGALDPIIFRRRLTRAGHTGVAEVVDNAILTDASHRIAAHFKPVGPTNLQFRMQGDIPYLLEINPRFSSSCSLRTAFGYNEAEMCIDYYLFGKRPVMPQIRYGTGQRYNEDFVTYARNHI